MKREVVSEPSLFAQMLGDAFAEATREAVARAVAAGVEPAGLPPIVAGKTGRSPRPKRALAALIARLLG